MEIFSGTTSHVVRGLVDDRLVVASSFYRSHKRWPKKVDPSSSNPINVTLSSKFFWLVLQELAHSSILQIVGYRNSS